eukprot:4079566-Ditylum_brightwellii.AAC.1
MLFERCKQTGRRLLVILTGEKSIMKTAVMAKIGLEKQSAFVQFITGHRSTSDRTIITILGRSTTSAQLFLHVKT